MVVHKCAAIIKNHRKSIYLLDFHQKIEFTLKVAAKNILVF